MAEMKVFRVEADTKGAVKNLKDVEIQTVKVITAQEVLQGILTKYDPLKDVVEKTLLHASKIGAIVTELNAHIEQAAAKNKEAAKSLVQDIEQSEEGILSSIKATVNELPAVMESYLNMTKNMSNMHSTLLAEQASKNKELIGKSLDEIKNTYIGKDTEIAAANLTTYRKYTEGLNNYKKELENAIVQTGLQYDSMSARYEKDGEAFKKVQEDKKAALESLQKKMAEVDTKIKESNISFLDEWNKQGDEVVKKATDQSKKIGDAVKDMTKSTDWNDKNTVSPFKSLNEDIKNIIKPLDDIQNKQKALYEQEIKYIGEKTARKKAELDEQIKELEKEVKDKKKELGVDELTYEKGVADKNATRYGTKITELEDQYGLKKNNESGEYEKSKDTTYSEEEIEAAKLRLEQLNGLKKQEEKNSEEKANSIKAANDIIFQSEEEILKQKQEIEAKKAELDRKAAEEKAKAEEKKAKKEAEMAKIKRIKDKAEHVVKIAQAVSDVAKGVAAAWSKPFIGPVLAALVAAQGGIQIKIMTEQLKYMKDGGLLNGKRHSQGGMRIEGSNIEVEGGEYVVNRESTSKNLGLVRYINSERRELKPADLDAYFNSRSLNREPAFSRLFENGGQLPIAEPAANIDNETLVQAIRSIRIEPRVAVTDIHKVQDSMVSVDSWTGV